METFFHETLILWKVLLIDVDNATPLTKREKIVKILRSVGSKLLLIFNVIMTVLIAPFLRAEELSNFFNNPKALWDTACVIGLLTIALRYFLLLTKFDKIRDLATGPLSGNYSKEQQSKYNINNKLTRLTNVLKRYRQISLSGLAIEILRHIYSSIFGDRKSALFVEFPFDATRDWIFHVMIPSIFIWDVLNALTVVVTDSLLCVMLTVASIELDIWRQDFKDLKDASEEEKSKKLPELIERHVALFDVVKRVEDIFSSFFLLNLLLDSVIISISLFIITDFNEPSRNITVLLFGSLIIVTIGGVCFFGQMLLNASEEISREIYDCGWESFKDNKLKKAVLMLLMRSQRPAKLTFMKFSDVNMEQFRGVVAATYAYFTLLLKLRSKV